MILQNKDINDVIMTLSDLQWCLVPTQIEQNSFLINRIHAREYLFGKQYLYTEQIQIGQYSDIEERYLKDLITLYAGINMIGNGMQVIFDLEVSSLKQCLCEKFQISNDMLEQGLFGSVMEKFFS